MTVSTAMRVEQERTKLQLGLERLIQLAHEDGAARAVVENTQRSEAENAVLAAAYQLRAAKDTASSFHDAYLTRSLLMMIRELPLHPQGVTATVTAAGEASDREADEREGLEPHVHRMDPHVDTGPAVVTETPAPLNWEAAEKHIRQCQDVYSQYPSAELSLVIVIRPLIRRLKQGERTQDLYDKIMEVKL